MKRRHLVVLVSAFTLLTIIFVAAVTIGVGVGTDPGREQIRSLIQQQVGNRVQGKIHIGRIGGGFLTGFTIDSFAIRDRRDSLFVSTGRVKVDYDLRDLFDRRLLLRNVEVEHPVIRLEQHPERDWNFQRIFKSSGPSAPDVPGRSFGDYVVLENVRVRDGTATLTRPWTPDDSLTGAKRDSAIRRNLENPNREIRRSGAGYTHTYRWSKASGVLPRIRLADPDSSRFGQMFVIEKLNVEEQEPPFSFRNGRGVVRKTGDSVFIDVSHFDLPASTGSARGKIWWGGGQPTRIDIRIRGDSVSLNDVAWVYETLPRTGVGFTNLRIRNNPENLDDFRHELTELDVRSTKSRLMGAMTFVVGGPVLEVVDVDLRAAPVNFDLVRTLAGEPLPVDWQGDLIGRVRGPGGPLTHFVVDESDVTWRDTHVRGAVSRFSGIGELDILDPEFTAFHGFQVNVASLDLRSIEYLFPSFPRIGGTIAGVATLDSVWLDVRFSKANVTHRNGPGDPTRVTGTGRVTYGEQFMSYNVSVNAEPLSLTMMSRAYPLGLKGLMSGPIKAAGTSNDMQVTALLEGPAGRFSYSGRVDAYPLSVMARGTGRVDALDLAQIIAKPSTPSGWITGAYQLNVRGDTNDLGRLTGTASAQIERAELDSIRVFPSRISARFADGRMFLDTLNVESVAATIRAAGALGLASRSADSIQYQIVVDSLGGLRRYVSRLTSSWEGPADAAADSLAGELTISGTASGSLRSLDLSGHVTGSNLFIRREAGKTIMGAFALTDVLSGPTGTASLRVEDLNVGRIALDTLGFLARFEAARHGMFALGAKATNGVAFAASGDLAMADGATDIVMREISMITDSSRWALRGLSTIQLRGKGIAIDSLVLANGRGGRVAVEGFVPDSGKGRLLMRADSVPLRDIERIAQLPKAASGWAHVTMQGAGTSFAPVMNLQARLDDVVYGTMQLEKITATAEYANRRAEVAVDLSRGERPAIIARASLPIELKYFGAQLLEDTLRGTIRTDNATFDVVQAFIPSLSNPKGRLVANIDIGGTWQHPDLSGPIQVEDGEVKVDSLGITLTGVNIDLALFGHSDSLSINRFVARSGPSPGDTVSLQGYIAYRDRDNPYVRLGLHARAFKVLDKRSVAQLFVSTESSGLRLRGRLRGATLTGGVVVDRGTIYLPDPELARKQVVDLTSAITDTSSAVREFLAEPTSPFLSNILFDSVRVTLGDEVFLRSREANIKLAGTLNVQRGTRVRREAGLLVEREEPVILLEGVLRAERGTYTLALDPLPIRREFQVETGTITFFGTSGLAPELNITALHTVRRSTGDDLRIRVRLTGPLYPNPIVTLESAESFALSQSDLVSYLIFGQPNFAIGAPGQENIQLAVQFLYPSLQSIATNVPWFGPLSSIFQLRPGSTDLGVENGSTGLGGVATNVILTTRLGAERQITDNVFVSLSTPICNFGGGGADQGGGEYFVSGLSGKIEWRLSRDASIKAGKEPSAMVCGRPSTGRVVPTPSQWGLSLFKSWRF